MDFQVEILSVSINSGMGGPGPGQPDQLAAAPEPMGTVVLQIQNTNQPAPMGGPGGGAQFTIHVPKSDLANWVPGTSKKLTIS